jgi:hypothetical protein
MDRTIRSVVLSGALALCLIASRATAAQCQHSRVADVLTSRVGARARLTTSADGSSRRIEGRIRSVHDSTLSLTATDGARVFEIGLSSIARVDIFERRDRSSPFNITAAGMVVGGLVANLRPDHSHTEPGLIGRLFRATGGAIIGGAVGEVIRRVLPDEHWLTVYDRSR